MASRTVFNIEGLDIGNANRNLTYLYGLSDFWQFIFEDSEKIELLLEATTQKLSDVYSRFLQLTSTISLTDIGVATHQQLKLVLIKDVDLIQGQVNTFTLSEPILSSRLIANRPLLPTAYLEDNIHYRIASDGKSITFFQPLSSIGFPSRVLSDGSVQYSMWFVDTLIDEQAVYQYFGKLIGVDPQVSTENFKNFVYGLYYLFINGPNLALIRKGLNLALGIPLAREAETVLEIRTYLDTDQFLVITDLNSYLIPFGLKPSVAVGDELEPTQELAQWVEVKDYINDGDWWINFAIPPQLMPYIPAGQPDRYAKVGSYADYVMRNFLKKHTFLVNVKTIDFKNLQSFEQLSDIINAVKPTYSYPIYIWTVPLDDENFNMNDDDFFMRLDQFRCENISLPVSKMQRLNAEYAASINVPLALMQAGDAVINSRQFTYRNARANIPVSGEMYWEMTVDKIAIIGEIAIGVCTSSMDRYTALGSDANAWVYLNSGSKRTNGSTSGFGAAFVAADVIGVKYKVSTGTLTFYKNGVSQGDAFTGLVGTLYPVIGLLGGDGAYYASPNVSGNYLSTPDAVANRITGDIDIRARIYAEDWAGGTVQNILAKEDGALRYQFAIATTGALSFVTSTLTATSSVVTGYAKRTANWIRVTRASSSGDVIFYTSTDGVTWTPLGTTQSTAAGNLVGTAGANVYVAWRPVTTQQPLFGRVHYIEVRAGINGTVAYRVEPGQLNIGGVLSIGSDTGEIWTITRNPVYLSVPGSTGNYASTVDSLKSSLTMDIDIQLDYALTNWASGSTQTLFSKYVATGNQKSYFFNVTGAGNLEFGISTDGSATTSVTSSGSTGFVGASRHWVRVTRTYSDGVVTFYTSTDGISWTPFGSTGVLLAASTIFDSTAPTQISGINDTVGGAQYFTGKCYSARLIGNGTTVLYFSPNSDANIGNTSLVSSTSGEIWIINQLGSPSPVANLATDTAQGKFLVLYLNPSSSVRSGGRLNFGNYPFTYLNPAPSTPGVYTTGTSLTRGCPIFTRSFVPHFAYQQLGFDSQINARPLSFDVGVVSGYINSIRQIRINRSREIAWIRSVASRASDSYRKPRSFMMFCRGESFPDSTGVPVRKFLQPDPTQRIVHLYNTNQAAIQEKFGTISGHIPGLDEWTFTLFRPFRTQTAINVTAIDQEYAQFNFFTALQATYSTMFFPSSTYTYLGNFMPPMAYRTYAPQLTDLQQNDYLLFIRIYENTVGVYWVTSNMQVQVPDLKLVERIDPFDVNSQDATIKHGFAYYSSYYLLRGAGSSMTHTTGATIDSAAINAGLGSTSTGISRTYSDDENPTPLVINHSGVVLKFRRDFK